MQPDKDERLPRRGAVPSPEYPAKSVKSVAHERSTTMAQPDGPGQDDRAARPLELARCCACGRRSLVRLRAWLAAFHTRARAPWACPWCGARQGFLVGAR